MADIITLTPQPVRVTSASYQPMYLATDIVGYDFLDIEVGVIANEGPVSSWSLELHTGMQNQTDDGWLNAGVLTTSVTANTWAKINYPNGLLRYVRWRISAMSGGTAMTFFIRGMARRYS